MKKFQKYIPHALFGLVLFIGVILAPRAGVTWDEPDNIFAGGVYVTFFQERFNSHAFDGFWDQRSYFRTRISTINPTLSHYPPVPTYVGSALTFAAERFGYGLTGPQLIVIFHIATVLFFALFISTTYRFALLIGLTPAAGLFVALATYLYPALFGHGLTNLKDTAQVTLFTLSLYYLVRGARLVKVRDVVAGAVVWGMGLSTKFNAVYVPIIWGVWVLISRAEVAKNFRSVFNFMPPFHVFHPKEKVNPDKIFLLPARLMVINFLLVIVIGAIVSLILWPYLWFDSVARVTEVFRYFTTIGQGYRILWNGAQLTIGQGVSYWWIPILSFIYGTPTLLLLAIATGSILLFTGYKPRWVSVLLAVWIVIPLVRTISPWSAYYDGIRHFMEIIPALMLISGVAIDWVFARSRFRGIAILLPAGILVQLVLVAMTYFPFSTGYYNGLAADPNVLYDRDIEGLSIREGLKWAGETYKNLKIYVPIAVHLSWYDSPRDAQLVYNIRDADTVVLMNKGSHHIDSGYKNFEREKRLFTLVHTIRRGDAIFGWVYRRTTEAK